jgi:hypothetical protein
MFMDAAGTRDEHMPLSGKILVVLVRERTSRWTDTGVRKRAAPFSSARQAA